MNDRAEDEFDIGDEVEVWDRGYWEKVKYPETKQNETNKYLQELKEILSYEESEAIIGNFDINYVKDHVEPRFKMILEELK